MCSRSDVFDCVRIPTCILSVLGNALSCVWLYQDSHLDSECACVQLGLTLRYQDSHLNFECACVQLGLNVPRFQLYFWYACVKLSLIVRYRDSHLNFECACVQMCLTQCVRPGFPLGFWMYSSKRSYLVLYLKKLCDCTGTKLNMLNVLALVYQDSCLNLNVIAFRCVIALRCVGLYHDSVFHLNSECACVRLDLTVPCFPLEFWVCLRSAKFDYTSIPTWILILKVLDDVDTYQGPPSAVVWPYKC